MGIQELRDSFNLKPNPEGGEYAETFRDDAIVLRKETLPSRFKVGRPVCTAIYFLLPTGSVSKLHRIPSAEVWHFYDGEPLTVFELNGETNAMKHTVLGRDIAAGQLPQYVVPPNVWFGAYSTSDYRVDVASAAVEKLPDRSKEDHYSFVGCTVAPAFEFVDFELAKRSELVSSFPQAKAFIELLTDAE